MPLDWRASMFSVTTSWRGWADTELATGSDRGQPWLSGQDSAVTTETAVTWAASLVSCLPDLEAAALSRLARGRRANSRNRVIDA